ncbi:MAG: GNAT family N-acetyltransferase [Eubacterium sp.]|nr:GNAT family N-acetyltransferase [Eubacterium sp.]
MLLKFKDLTIRNATEDDAAQLAKWWNDGTVMAHAGFPNGLGTTAEEIAESLARDTDEYRRLIIEKASVPIGETNYEDVGDGTARIGIKICDFSLHDKGLGRVLLGMLISSLFNDMGYKKIILDTNVNNKRAQHVYEMLGFKKVRLCENAWTDQLGNLQSFIDYEMYPEDFVNFAK